MIELSSLARFFSRRNFNSWRRFFELEFFSAMIPR